MKVESLDILIPVLNEGAYIERLLDDVDEAARVARSSSQYRAARIRKFVIDGGSSDDTMRRASAGDCNVIGPVEPGRGGQYAAGVGAGDGRWLLFLHADMRLEPRALLALFKLIGSDGEPRWGIFGYRHDSPKLKWGILGHRHDSPQLKWGILGHRHDSPQLKWGILGHRHDSPKLKYRVVLFWNRLRFRLFRLAYGDQGIFVRRDVLDEIGGFPKIPLFEDVELSLRLRRYRPRRAGSLIRSSVRKWEKHGYWKYNRMLCAMSVRYLWARSMGVPAHEIAWCPMTVAQIA